MALSDVDATNYELEQAVLESSLQTFARQEQGRKQRASPKRRRGRNSPPVDTPALLLPAFGESTSNVAAIPPAAASVASAASAASSSSETAAAAPPPLGSADEYPQAVQELVMNGFDLRKVVHAYELIGDNFDDLLAFLMSTSTNSS